MILEKLEYCPLCEADYATQYEYDFQICNNCDPIPTIEEIEAGSFSTAQVAAMAKRIAELEAELSTLKAQREWVSVEERLPELETEVLVWNTHHESMYTDSWCELSECPVIFSTHSVVTGVGWRDNDPEDISHWLPIPAAPEGE